MTGELLRYNPEERSWSFLAQALWRNLIGLLRTQRDLLGSLNERAYLASKRPCVERVYVVAYKLESSVLATPRLRGESDAAQKVGEARVGAHLDKGWAQFQEAQ